MIGVVYKDIENLEEIKTLVRKEDLLIPSVGDEIVFQNNGKSRLRKVTGRQFIFDEKKREVRDIIIYLK
jgi:hypothetical protein